MSTFFIKHHVGLIFHKGKKKKKTLGNMTKYFYTHT